VLNIRALTEKFDFSDYLTLLDIGGREGDRAIQIAKKFENLTIKSSDMPKFQAPASRAIAEQGLSDRVTAIDFDFLKEQFPASDIVTMGKILSDWGPDGK
jgi:cyclopropane fatty-acyl-phospholipid synthase-like methyltransferase